MDCLLETVASGYMFVRSRLVPQVESELCSAEEHLQECRANLSAREGELSKTCVRLGRDALRRKRTGDPEGSRMCVRERKQVLLRLEKVRNSLALVDKQLEALRSSEMDKEIMLSLKMSSDAMKKAGIAVGVEEAEKVINELEDRLEDASEVTNLLSAPLMYADGVDELDLEAELGLIGEDGEVLRTQVLPPALEQKMSDSDTPVPQQAAAALRVPVGDRPGGAPSPREAMLDAW